MPTELKSQAVAEIRTRFEESSAVILFDYRGLSVKEMAGLRAAVRDASGEVKIYKNTLTQIAVGEIDMPSMDEYLTGPTAFVFVPTDPVAPAKALIDFAKEHKALEVKGGYVQGLVVDANGVKAIASLPSREELIAKLLGTLQNPLTQTVRVLNGPASAFARVLNAVAEQKGSAAA